MNRSEWADRVGVNKNTAYRWYREGKLPVPVRRVGKLILVDVDRTVEAERARTVLYARVSSDDQRADLDRQVARLSVWATSVGMSVDEVVTEVGSGMDGNRLELRRLLADPTASVILVEHRDRLAPLRCGTWRPPSRPRRAGSWWSRTPRWWMISSGT
jgi:putative resolvase